MLRRFLFVLVGLSVPAGGLAAQPAAPAPVRLAHVAAPVPTPARSVVLRTAIPAPEAPMPARGDEWIAYDKAQHFLASALLVLATQYVLEAKGGAGRTAALPFAVGVSASAGFAKESFDARRARATDYSKKDLAADAAGIAAAVAVILW